MPNPRAQLSTGLPGLDRVLRGLMPGDNIVWQVESVDEYAPFVQAFAAYARESHQRLIYFRFADHPPLLEDDGDVECRALRPSDGFEPFLGAIHETVDAGGRGGLYVFDCLSELAPDWCSDRMLGNFFMLTCPYVYDRAAIAWFTVLRNRHSFHAMTPIADTTQILVDAYKHRGALYIHPLKVQFRHSPTMYMLHRWEPDGAFTPVTQSGIITEILHDLPWSRLDTASYMLGYWSKTFAKAEEVQERLDRGEDVAARARECFCRLLRMLVSREGRVLELAGEYLTLRDLLDVRRRMIGTGLIGGKSVGMLLARAVLRRQDPRWEQVLEPHDSFYVGADVFYTYLVQNGCWWLAQKYRGGIADAWETGDVRRRIMAGEFPEYIVRQFDDMLDYFGQSPIIVRSSSLLEDNFGNAFAGKYDSVFCANQGGPDKRLQDFLAAVRAVYASTLGEAALSYRAQRGLLQRDEQMGLLIQRVSGATYGNFFYPQAAGVGFSFNPYVWDPKIDPAAGMLRLVFGVGTRAVDRADDDYTRVVALNAPTKRPESDPEAVRQYAQRRVDVLDLDTNQLTSAPFEDIVKRSEDLPIAMFASRDRRLDRERGRRGTRDVFPWVLTFQKLLTKTGFVQDMRGMLRVLQEAYAHAVDIEFTANFFDSESYRINLVQCRPLEVQEPGVARDPPEHIPPQDLLVECRGSVIGKSNELAVDWIVYVVPRIYAALPMQARYAVAHTIGAITRHPEIGRGTIMLIGPGRWGTTTPALGVPVSAAELGPASVLCEVAAMHDNLVPDVSLGTHFFNELVEKDMLYMAVFPGRESDSLNADLLEQESLNRRSEFVDAADAPADAVRLIRASDFPRGTVLRLNANALKQRAVCYLERAGDGASAGSGPPEEQGCLP